MSRDWNGLSLQNEFAALLSDTSTTFKAKVLIWINDIQNDIIARFDWPMSRQKGKKTLTASSEQQDLTLGTPSAPSVATSTGGSLTADTAYKVLVTFYESVADIESIGGIESASVTPTGTDLQIDVTSIPVSSDGLVTARKIYLVKGDGEPLYYSTISDNTTTTATITADTSSLIEAPDYTYFKKISGSPFLEGDNSGYINYKPVDQLRLMFQGTWSTGTPEFWADIEEGKVELYPPPSSALTMSFYYFKMPERITASKTSQPFLPAWLKPVLKAGVLAYGYEDRDRSGVQLKFQNYESLMTSYISKMGRNKKTATRVRDVAGNADGFSLA